MMDSSPEGGSAAAVPAMLPIYRTRNKSLKIISLRSGKATGSRYVRTGNDSAGRDAKEVYL